MRALPIPHDPSPLPTVRSLAITPLEWFLLASRECGLIARPLDNLLLFDCVLVCVSVPLPQSALERRQASADGALIARARNKELPTSALE